MKKSKIAIITLTGNNYGNKYQNYAVEQLLSKYGEVETYGLEKIYQMPQIARKKWFSKFNPIHIKNVLTLRPMYQYDLNCIDRGILRNLLYIQIHRRQLLALREKRRLRFLQFTKTYLHISDQVLNKENTTQEWADGIECFICGSDQIWNPFYATTSKLAFCSFAPEKTICLAPSFGVSKIPNYRIAEYSKWLKPIKSLSVRENVGQRIIKDLTGRHAEVLLDPTMALPLDKWNELCKKPEEKLPEQYVACYFLGKIDKIYRKQIHDFSKKMNLSVVMLFDITIPEYYTFDPSEVLYTIKNADYILTDSFHGTVFSILFHKNFFVFNRNEGSVSMNSRLDTLLGKFKLLNRYYRNDYFESITSGQWKFVEAIIVKERSKILSYIENAINDIRKEEYE